MLSRLLISKFKFWFKFYIFHKKKELKIHRCLQKTIELSWLAEEERLVSKSKGPFKRELQNPNCRINKNVLAEKLNSHGGETLRLVGKKCIRLKTFWKKCWCRFSAIWKQFYPVRGNLAKLRDLRKIQWHTENLECNLYTVLWNAV